MFSNTDTNISQMHEERDRCRELIRELQSHVLEREGQQKPYEKGINMVELQRLRNGQSIRGDRSREILNSLEGKTIGGTLDFLNKVSFVKLFRSSLLISLFLSFPEANEIRGRT